MPEQLSFDLPRIAALGRDDFFVAPSNRLAVAMIERPETWPGGKLILNGPAGAGKTHLSHVWATQTGAHIIEARDLEHADIPDLSRAAIVVENAPDIATQRVAQDALFHLHNLVLANGNPLLVTGRGTPRHWGLDLPDLQSRMDGTQTATLDPPDDQLLSVVLAKLFADLQIVPKADVIPFLVKRMDRSFEAAQSVVDQLDRASLSQGRNLTRSFAAQVLGHTGNSE